LAEIKSTLDLVMEKTRNMILTPEEKERLDDEKAIKQARGLFQKYVDGLWGLQELEQYVEQDESNREKIRKNISLLIIQRVSTSMAGTSQLEDIKAWLGTKAADEIDQAVAILVHYQKEASDLHRETESRLRRELEKRGIQGSAVKPKVTEDKQWQARSEELKREAEQRLENIKNNLSKLL
jgi:hypothetical protein